MFLSIETITRIPPITFYGLIFLVSHKYYMFNCFGTIYRDIREPRIRYIPASFIVNRCFFSFYRFKREIKPTDSS